MDITVMNPPASGANMSENTDWSILCYADYIQKKGNITIPFSKFREDVSATMGTNLKNDRTVYPMLKYLGLIQYTAGEDLSLLSFFTKTGNAYVNCLRMEKQVKNSEDNKGDKIKEKALETISDMKRKIIFHGLYHLLVDLSDEDVSYRSMLINTLKYLLKFGSIDRSEFGYMVYLYQNRITNENAIFRNIYDYRNGDLEIKIFVDAYDKRKGANTRTKKSVSNLTAYGYYMSLLLAAGIVYKGDKPSRYCINDKERDNISSIIRQAEHK